MYPKTEGDDGHKDDEGETLMLYGKDSERHQDAFVTKRVTLLRYFNESLLNCFHVRFLFSYFHHMFPLR